MATERDPLLGYEPRSIHCAACHRPTCGYAVRENGTRFALCHECQARRHALKSQPYEPRDWQPTNN